MGKSASHVQEILSYIKSNKIQFVDFKFMDFPGQWQHFTIPSSELKADSFEDGFGFDGSSIRGWKSIHESDMLLIPDAETMFFDPFIEAPTISLICDVYEPATKEKYDRCPRNIAQKAEAYLHLTLDLKQNFLFLTMSVSIPVRTFLFILLILLKANGIQGVKKILT